MTIRLQFFRYVLGMIILLLTSPSLRAADAPSQAFVVNTGDGSVSLVDLAKMAEIKKHEVGKRPY